MEAPHPSISSSGWAATTSTRCLSNLRDLSTSAICPLQDRAERSAPKTDRDAEWKSHCPAACRQDFRRCTAHGAVWVVACRYFGSISWNPQRPLLMDGLTANSGTLHPV